MSPRRSRETRRGAGAFTLIELLVVVAIIALLLSILLPSLERARAQARQLQRLTNLGSMGQAAFYYAEDNDDWIARNQSWNPRSEWGMQFSISLLPWLGFSGHVDGI